MNQMRVMLMAIVLLGAATWAEASSRIVLDATPAVRIDSGPDATRRRVLTREEALKARLLIVETDGRYFWATRENRELVWTSGGATNYFIDPSGGGYVKVAMDFEAGPDSAGTYQFYEHVSLGMLTITYFGACRSFTP